MKLDVINIQGNKTGKTVELPDAIFGLEPNEHAMYLAVKQYLAAQRQGTHKAKERGEIAGSTKKIKKQKGTGTARSGSIKSPLFRGGGRIFGPRPRNYNIKLNKKVKQLARNSALSTKAAADSIIVVEDFTFDAPKTKEFAGILKSLDLVGKKSTFVTKDLDKTLYMSSRNLPKTSLKRAQDLNTYEVLNGGTIVLSESSVEQIKEIFG